MYFDSRRDIEEDIRQLGKVMDYTKGNGLIIAVDSNARSKMWHDTITNQRGKILEEFIICNDLHSVRIDNSTFERVEEFKHLGTALTNQNSIAEEIKSRLRSGNACYHSVQTL